MRFPVTMSLIISFSSTALTAQTGGLLSAYQSDPAERPAFDAGYAEHLAWHAAAGDSLRWFGWDVIIGESIGMFVDGTFGLPFTALDRRVDPAGDAANAAGTFAPHADPAFRYMLRFRPDLSTDHRLATEEPTRLVQVVRYTPDAGDVPALEAAFRAVRAAPSLDNLLPFSVYEVVAGTGSPSFLLMVWRETLGSFDAYLADPVRWITDALHESDVASAADAAVGEVWRYRPDLTYLGANRSAR